mmetsp:Transcript_37910/g.77358  ORF Transcript_37910/g.77358 Transcript_37910/m.77358 type:complete len:215 (-) Transcript_37910:262-906(-)|eukprot:CAMPEP_0183325076 /NCGR_PEP_ID=MMETSP0160_2-20130417/78722_1 /TAXON_ID=2839 ORGANISM="Odontella Sinensis, Strain Grunow 1884" /NCGR_SAMPLE_ID=MMETSP0160_2 /ASSEMBLY_ACC=CAM_ASM_000250 /LENGTH=214 /DNA_ID=CAMNT_0025492799 /DNA_START=125 /DNA_END=769 /DNA_ORIENTATION=-
MSRDKRKRCSVRFSLRPTTVLLSQQPFTEAEINQSWWSIEESTEFKKRAYDDTVRYMLEKSKIKKKEIGPCHWCLGGKIGHSNNEPFCYRGLEHRASLGRMKDRIIAIRAVLEVQTRLSEGRVQTGRDPATVLSLVSQKLTEKARERAYCTGKSDAIQAFLAHKSVPSPVELCVDCHQEKSQKRKAEFQEESCQNVNIDQRQVRPRLQMRMRAT